MWMFCKYKIIGKVLQLYLNCRHISRCYIVIHNYDVSECSGICAGWSGPEVIKHFSCSTQLSIIFVLLINLKLLTTANYFLLNIAEHENFSANKYENVGIFIFIRWENFITSGQSICCPLTKALDTVEYIDRLAWPFLLKTPFLVVRCTFSFLQKLFKNGNCLILLSPPLNYGPEIWRNIIKTKILS